MYLPLYMFFIAIIVIWRDPVSTSQTDLDLDVEVAIKLIWDSCVNNYIERP